jgi:hypothetical protein
MAARAENPHKFMQNARDRVQALQTATPRTRVISVRLYPIAEPSKSGYHENPMMSQANQSLGESPVGGTWVLVAIGILAFALLLVSIHNLLRILRK